MKSEMYQMIADENELRWFFDHCVNKPNIVEGYSAVFVSRHKKLTKEEQEEIGLTRKESEFLAVQTIRCPRFKDGQELSDLEDKFTFEKFLRTIRRFNVDKYAYTTAKGEPLPEKTLAIIFYINPYNAIKVADLVYDKLNFAKSAISTAMLNGKTLQDVAQIYQTFDNIEESVKHCRAQAKGSVFFMDFDVDVPDWFRPILGVDANIEFMNLAKANPNLLGKDVMKLHDKNLADKNKYYDSMCEKLNNRFGKGNYVIVDTSGGYHILVRTNAIKSNPHDFCKEVDAIYKQGVADGYPEYRNEKGELKYECVINDSQIPGIPLPGTYQYGRPVTILNKEDFE